MVDDIFDYKAPIMKNWYKTFNTPEYEGLIRKGFEDDHYLIIISMFNEGVEATIKLSFKTYEKRDESFDKDIILLKPAFDGLYEMLCV